MTWVHLRRKLDLRDIVRATCNLEHGTGAYEVFKNSFIYLVCF